MRSIAMTGATGFVGTHLCRNFKENGWEVIKLGRKEFAQSIEELARQMQGVDIVVNLAGTPVISRWTEQHKQLMYESRISLTKKLVKACRIMKTAPRVFLSTSAIGCYAATGTHTEEKNIPADDFLGQLTRDWENEAFRAKEMGSRTIIFRLGVVLGPDGGALAKMLLPFKLGLGGPIGNGSQPFSWIHITDLVTAAETAINESEYEGVYNLTAPNPTTNLGLTQALGKALSRPAILPVPEFALRLIYGEGAQVLTSGQNVIPERLLDAGFRFDFPLIQDAVRDCVKS